MNFPILKRGDTVDIVIPATSCTKGQILEIKHYITDELHLIPRILMQKETTPTKTSYLENEFPSYDAKARFDQFYDALKSNSKIVWCARGGYGSGDLLPFLEKAKKVKQNKIFIGFSDICSVATFLQDKWDWKILCAPVLVQLGRGDIKRDPENELKELLFGEKSDFSYDLVALNQIKQEINKTPVTGGCISVLAGHFGTKFQINFKNKILFLEDEGEDGERLDRYFRQLVEMILSNKKLPKAILLGNFLETNNHGSPKAKNIEIAINRLVERLAYFKLKIPVFMSKDKNLGHSRKMRPLLLGHNAKIVFSPNLQLKISIKS